MKEYKFIIIERDANGNRVQKEMVFTADSYAHARRMLTEYKTAQLAQD